MGEKKFNACRILSGPCPRLNHCQSKSFQTRARKRQPDKRKVEKMKFKSSIVRLKGATTLSITTFSITINKTGHSP